jgi:hypothetical protein
MIGWLQNLDENARSVSLSQASLNFSEVVDVVKAIQDAFNQKSIHE